MINSTAQDKGSTRLPDAKRKRLQHMLALLTASAFFDCIFQRLALRTEVGKQLLQRAVLFLRIVDLFDGAGLDIAVILLPVVTAAP